MLRATSEIAVAMSARSVLEKPSCSARPRPVCRAVTMSESDEIAIRVSSPTDAVRDLQVQVREPLLEVQRRVHPLQGQAQLHHRKRHIRLYPHDDGVGSSQLR